MFNGKSIFISGGTGSFGRKFIARLLELNDAFADFVHDGVVAIVARI